MPKSGPKLWLPRKPASQVWESDLLAAADPPPGRLRGMAGVHRVGATELQRCGRAVGLPVAAIGRQVRRDLVGAAEHRYWTGCRCCCRRAWWTAELILEIACAMLKRPPPVTVKSSGKVIVSIA